MSNLKENRSGFLQKTWVRMTQALAQEPPEEYSACAFRCHNQECHHDQWDSCEHRLSGMQPRK